MTCRIVLEQRTHKANAKARLERCGVLPRRWTAVWSFRGARGAFAVCASPSHGELNHVALGGFTRDKLLAQRLVNTDIAGTRMCICRFQLITCDSALACVQGSRNCITRNRNAKSNPINWSAWLQPTPPWLATGLLGDVPPKQRANFSPLPAQISLACRVN